jgi:ADP-heptose:LPS heptosyltransferase
MRILVLRGGAIGDFLVTLPALQLLRDRWPAAQIELAGNPAAAALGVDFGPLDAAHSQHEARWSALFRDGALPADFAAWLARFDLVLNYWPDPDGCLARRFPLRPGQQYLSAPAQPVLAPAARHFCEPLRALGLAASDYRARLHLPSADDLGPSTGGRRRPIALHPGSGSPRKNWPLERWEELCSRLPAPLLIVGGEADAAALHTLARFGVTALNRPLTDLARDLARCRLFVGHDSGISHLAAAVGTPCVLLFGPTDPAMWAPPGDPVRVLRRGPALEAISVDDVWAATAQPAT